ncbi:hypothetical protein [Fischerella sp. JS2]|uniref:hypothetical protein n=1 Tax=Fischerella sp. JS2 TaxID=2597771 RepID=UPI0028E4BA41|nr:hypothetical protein [Fischerella sp. JS2]
MAKNLILGARVIGTTFSVPLTNRVAIALTNIRVILQIILVFCESSLQKGGFRHVDAFAQRVALRLSGLR